MLRRRVVSALVALALIAGAGFGFLKIPTAFIPTEDQGYVMVIVQLPDAASLQRTEQLLAKIVTVANKLPSVKHTITIAGISPLDSNATLSNAGLVYIVLKDWGERGPGQDLRSIYQTLSAEMNKLPEAASAKVLVPPPINGLGLAGGFQMQVELTDGSTDYHKLSESANALVSAAVADPRILVAFTSLRVNVPQLELRFNRARAESLGVSVSDAYSAIQSYLGSSYVNQFSKFGQNFTVYVQADQPYRADVDAIGRLTVANRSGQMVPISSFMNFSNTTGPAVATQYNLMPSATINGAAAPGHSSGEALELLEGLAKKTLPPGVGFEWTAMSYQEKLVGGSVGLVFGLALLLVYLVLAGQYESWLTPVPVLLAVPLSLVGTVAVLMGLHVDNNIYVQIGLVLLIALSAKNAILIVEVAHELHEHGMELVASAIEGSKRRFRPILMTSFAFILGVVPLILSSGAGASARKSIGITVFSGMLASTVLAVAFVPVFFVLIGQWQQHLKNKKNQTTDTSAGDRR
jgi:HAE1 family hydrophobic/amphiphilic exporter-1